MRLLVTLILRREEILDMFHMSPYHDAFIIPSYLKAGSAKYSKCPSVQNAESSMMKTSSNLLMLQIMSV